MSRASVSLLVLFGLPLVLLAIAPRAAPLAFAGVLVLCVPPLFAAFRAVQRRAPPVVAEWPEGVRPLLADA